MLIVFTRVSSLTGGASVCHQGATAQQKELIEQAAQVLSQDNVELACAFIQKNAVEKAIPDMDKRLATVRLVTLRL